MKLFIGWSGERSRALAQALHDWVPLVLHYAQPWLSETDIDAGERWAQAIGKELEASNFGIVSLTRENLNSPWVLFEAGSLAKSLEESRVIPVLLDLEYSEISGPLAQFQAKKADKDGISEVIRAIQRVAEEPVDETRAAQLFDKLWPSFHEQLESIPPDSGDIKTMRPQHEILEELVTGVRSLDSLMREVAMGSEDLVRRRRWGRHGGMHPRFLREIVMMTSEGPGDPTALLVITSMFREDLPWLYELGLEAYKAAKDGTPEEAKASLRRLRKAVEILSRGPFLEEMGFHPRDLMMLTEELLHILPEVSSPERAPRRRRKKTENEG